MFVFKDWYTYHLSESLSAAAKGGLVGRYFKQLAHEHRWPLWCSANEAAEEDDVHAEDDDDDSSGSDSDSNEDEHGIWDARSKEETKGLSYAHMALSVLRNDRAVDALVERVSSGDMTIYKRGADTTTLKQLFLAWHIGTRHLSRWARPDNISNIRRLGAAMEAHTWRAAMNTFYGAFEDDVLTFHEKCAKRVNGINLKYGLIGIDIESVKIEKGAENEFSVLGN